MDNTTKVAGAHVVFYRVLKTCCCEARHESVRAIMLCKRTQDAPTHPGYWALFGGKLNNAEETPKDAAKREVEEELGLILEARRLEELGPPVCVARADGACSIQYFHYLLDYDLDKLTLRPNRKGKVEGEGLGWFTAEEIHHLMVRPEDRIAVDNFFREHGT
ncbi:MAG: NUDIX domain-containing protein [Gemmataceae bacterium]